MKDSLKFSYKVVSAKFCGFIETIRLTNRLFNISNCKINLNIERIKR